MTNVIALAPRLDTPAAEPRAASLSARTGDVTLDAAGTTHIGALCLQVILAALAEAASRGDSLRLVNASPEIEDQLSLFGLRGDDLSADAEGGA